MGQIRQVEPVKFFCGMLSAYPGAFAEAESRLSRAIGEVELRSDLFAHAFTEYYRDEMGHPLVRYFVAFVGRGKPERLVDLKGLTNRVEADLAETGEWPVVRPVNLDPGYIAPSKLVLASTKNHAHRIPVGQGIYAELTLQYRGGAWQDLPWTYPDFRTPEYHGFFDQVRERLMAERGREDA